MWWIFLQHCFAKLHCKCIINKPEITEANEKRMIVWRPDITSKKPLSWIFVFLHTFLLLAGVALTFLECMVCGLGW